MGWLEECSDPEPGAGLRRDQLSPKKYDLDLRVNGDTFEAIIKALRELADSLVYFRDGGTSVSAGPGYTYSAQVYVKAEQQQS